jgi:hypothetical protein
MDDIVRILFVEDTEDDVELARRELDRDGLRFTWRHVTTESGLWRALLEFSARRYGMRSPTLLSERARSNGQVVAVVTVNLDAFRLEPTSFS